MAILHIISFMCLGGHRLALEFDDGTCGEVDLADELGGEVFAPLRDPEFFARVCLVGGTLAWPNGADMAPEYLKSLCLEAVRESPDQPSAGSSSGSKR